jgi:uncharacterized repeat protein (TIGR01451 family)
MTDTGIDVYVTNLRTGHAAHIISDDEATLPQEEQFTVNIGDICVVTTIIPVASGGSANNTTVVVMNYDFVSTFNQLNQPLGIDFERAGCFIPLNTSPLPFSPYFGISAADISSLEKIIPVTIVTDYVQNFSTGVLATMAATTSDLYWVYQAPFRVTNIPQNFAGTVYTFNYLIVYYFDTTNPGSSAPNITATVDFIIGEPGLFLQQTAVTNIPLLPILPGGQIVYNFSIYNDAITDNPNNSTAYDIILNASDINNVSYFSSESLTTPTSGWQVNDTIASAVEIDVPLVSGSVADFTATLTVRSDQESSFYYAPTVYIQWNSQGATITLPAETLPTSGRFATDVTYGRNGFDIIGINDYHNQEILPEVHFVPPAAAITLFSAYTIPVGATVNTGITVTVPPSVYSQNPVKTSTYTMTIVITPTNLAYVTGTITIVTAVATSQGLLQLPYNGTFSTPTISVSGGVVTVTIKNLTSYDGTNGNTFAIFPQFTALTHASPDIGSLAVEVEYKPNSNANQSVPKYDLTVYSPNLTIVPAASLSGIPYSISKEASAITAKAGVAGTITYTLQVTNYQTTTNTANIYIIDTIPVGATTTDSNWTQISGQTYYTTLTPTQIAAGGYATVTFVVNLAANYVSTISPTTTNTAYVAATNTGTPVAISNTALATDTIPVTLTATTLPSVYQVSKNVSSVDFTAGNAGTITYNIQVTNISDNPTSGLTLVDIFPQDVAITLGANTFDWVSTTIGTGSLKAATLDLPDPIPAGATFSYSLVLDVANTLLLPTLYNQAYIADTTDPTTSISNTGTAETVVPVTAGYTVSKASTTVALTPGANGTITYSIQVTNTSNAPNAAFTLVDIFPTDPAVTLDPIQTIAWTQTTIGTNAGAIFGVTAGNIPAGTTKSFPIVLDVAKTVAASILNNEAYVALTAPYTTPVSNLAYAPVNVPTVVTEPTAFYSISKAATSVDVTSGLAGTITYNIQVTNPAATDSPVLTLIDILPPLVTHTSTTDGWTAGQNNTITYSLPSIPAGQTTTTAIPLTLNVPADFVGDTVVNTVYVGSSATTLPQNALSNTFPSSVTIPVTGVTPVVPPTFYAITKTAISVDVTSGVAGTITYSIQVSNPSLTASGPLTLIDTLPVGATHTSTTDGWVAGLQNNTITYALTNIPASSTTAVIPLTLNIPADFVGNTAVNTVYVGNDASTLPAAAVSNTFPSSVTIPTTSVTPVLPPTFYAITKAAMTVAVTTGVAGTITYNIQVSNPAVTASPVLTLIDTLPIGTTHTANDGWVAGTQPGTITYPLPSIPAGQTTAVVQLTLNIPADFVGNTVLNTVYVGSSAETLPINALSNTDASTVVIPPAAVIPPVIPPAVLTMTKSIGGYNPMTNEVTYNIYISNSSITNSATTGIVLFDQIPAGTTIVAGQTWQNSAGTLYFQDLPEIVVNVPVLRTMVVTLNTPISNLPYINTAYVQVNGTTVSTDSATLTLAPAGTVSGPQLLIQKAVSSYIQAMNGTRLVSYVITVSNVGGSTATDLVLHDTVPSGTTASGDWSDTTGTITQAIPDLTAGTSNTYDITLALPSSYTLPTVLNTVYLTEGEILGPSAQAIFTLPVMSGNCSTTGLIPGCC